MAPLIAKILFRFSPSMCFTNDSTPWWFLLSFSGLNKKIPFVKPAPIDEQEAKKQKKHKEAQAKKGNPEQ